MVFKSHLAIDACLLFTREVTFSSLPLLSERFKADSILQKFASYMMSSSVTFKRLFIDDLQCTKSSFIVRTFSNEKIFFVASKTMRVF